MENLVCAAILSFMVIVFAGLVLYNEDINNIH